MPDFQATILAVHDGDTVTARIELPLGVSLTDHIRLVGIDADELSSPLGPAARDFLSDLCLQRIVRVQISHDLRDKYGRLLGELFDDARRPGVSINKQMLRHPFCRPYGVERDSERIS